MSETSAIILSGNAAAAEKCARLLDFFGVPSRVLSVAGFLELLKVDGAEKFRVICPAEIFSQLTDALPAGKIHSAFVHAAESFSGAKAGETRADGFKVSGQLNEFCGVMAGVSFGAGKNSRAHRVLKIPGAEQIIFNADGASFLKCETAGVPVFISTTEPLDLAADLPGLFFDVRNHFAEAVPLVLYARWAFAATCWQPAETCACLVIDDPLLRPNYGFINFDRLLAHMERENFSTSIAFIPWNWNRSSRRTARLFNENSRRLSLSVHGCDHTAGEYGDASVDRLAWKSRLALERMARHKAQTAVAHDRVMVFPQGVFSAAAMRALKHNNFIGTVNSEVFSADAAPPKITIGDYWKTAVMNFDEFPIFTRRYPWAGVENFAFDILLGKPCLVVVHQNDCFDDCRHVTDCIAGLNKLNARLRWTNLAEVVRRSFRQREVSPDAVEVEIFGSEARLENNFDAKKTLRVFKPEADVSQIRAVRADGRDLPWRAKKSGIGFEIELNPGEARTVAVEFVPLAGEPYAGENFIYQVKTFCRRRLCEARDNYLRRKKFSE